jgi:hypothetical protein
VSTREIRRREQTQQRQARVRSTITRSVISIKDDQLDETLVGARATGGIPLRELADHFEAHPDALLSGAAVGPKVLFRLLGLLASAGHPVTLPRCTNCTKETTDLPRFTESGRICRACEVKRDRHDCDRCGRPRTRIAARRAEGRICYSCYRTDPDRVEARGRCGQCGLAKPVAARLPDGSALCHRCWVPPQRQCVRCGHVGRAVFVDRSGPLCATCYRHHEQPRSICGRCGKVRIVARRGRNGEPDLCDSCYIGPSHTCGRCGRNRPAHRSATGEWICKSCKPRSQEVCGRCGRSRPVWARLPLGPVCNSCYCRLHDHPGHCAGCHQVHVLIGHDERGDVCGHCAGSGQDPRCRTCGLPGRHYTGQKCARCVLADQVDDLFSRPDGSSNAQLKPVRQLLLFTDRPGNQIGWIAHSQTAHLLRKLAAIDGPITHNHLDALPQGRHEVFLRQLLVQAGVFPPRNDDLERIPPWLDTLLGDEPEHRARLIRQFAHWFVLRRARRFAASRRYPNEVGKELRKQIRVALEFLTWLNALGLDLPAVNQTVLDQWLSCGNTRSYDVRYFVAWARSRRLVSDLRVPSRARPQPEHLLDEQRRWQLLERCFDDTSIALDTRAAAALILLFGFSITRIRHLTTDYLKREDDHTYLRIGAHHLLLPPKLAHMLTDLGSGEHQRSRYTHTPDNPKWLFPGLVPGRPLSADGLRRKLNDFGFHPRPARNAALASLAAELPSAVLADLVGMHHTTAARWAQLAARDWHAFVAARPGNTAATE